MELWSGVGDGVMGGVVSPSKSYSRMRLLERLLARSGHRLGSLGISTVDVQDVLMLHAFATKLARIGVIADLENTPSNVSRMARNE